MSKKDLQIKIDDLNSKLFDKDRKIFELESFVRIGDERLEKMCKRFDKKLVIINKIKKLLDG